MLAHQFDDQPFFSQITKFIQMFDLKTEDTLQTRLGDVRDPSVGDELSQNIIYQQQSANLTQLEEDVRALKRNSEHQFIIMNDGSYIEKRKNVLRRMH